MLTYDVHAIKWNFSNLNKCFRLISSSFQLSQECPSNFGECTIFICFLQSIYSYLIVWMNYLTLILTTDTIRHNYNSLTHSVWINNYKKDGWCIFCMWHKNIYNTCKFSCIVCFTLWLGYLANSYIRYFKYKNNDESKNYLLLQICLH